MLDGEINDILKRGADGLPEVDRAVVDRAAASVRNGLVAVRPLPAAWVWQAGLAGIASAVGIAGALILGPAGVRKMNSVEAAAIFSVLALLTWMAATVAGAEMVPGSRRRVAPASLCVVCCGVLAVLFGALFTDYGTERFVAQGSVCLKAGLLHAVPAMLVTGWLLSRGVALDTTGAGMAVGTLAGLAGVIMLELHCANFEAPHVMVWHIAVMPLSGAMGVIAARVREKRKQDGPQRNAGEQG